MAGKNRVKVEGLREVDAALATLPRATGKNVLRRVALARLEPMAEDARSRAPKHLLELKDSIAVSTKSSRYAKWKSKKQNTVEAYMGPGGEGSGHAPPQGSLQEFGTVNHGPQPFMRPAWDQGKSDLLDGIAEDLWSEIEKAGKRLAAKAARLAAKG